MSKMDEIFANPLYFSSFGFATKELPSKLALSLNEEERMPYGYQIDDEKTVVFRFYYPHAKSVVVKSYDWEQKLEKRDNIWTGRVKLQGICFLWLEVDGNMVINPYLPICFSDNRPINFIDTGENKLLEIKEVDHGVVVTDYVHCQSTGNWERIQIYLPALYFLDDSRSFPVLYLQHGIGENETSWVNQGRINFLLDNLIAEGSVEPMILVMANGMLLSKDEDKTLVNCLDYPDFLINDLMPYITARYHVLKGKKNTAVAGLSMGSIQAAKCAFLHPKYFSAAGLFSGFLSNIFSDTTDYLTEDTIQNFKDNNLYFFRSIGENDPFLSVFETDDVLISEHSLACDRRIYPGAHEWNVWRLCVVDFMKNLFK